MTKKTVFKWQDGFWVKMKAVFDAKYKVPSGDRRPSDGRFSVAERMESTYGPSTL